MVDEEETFLDYEKNSLIIEDNNSLGALKILSPAWPCLVMSVAQSPEITGSTHEMTEENTPLIS